METSSLSRQPRPSAGYGYDRVMAGCKLAAVGLFLLGTIIHICSLARMRLSVGISDSNWLQLWQDPTPQSWTTTHSGLDPVCSHLSHVSSPTGSPTDRVRETPVLTVLAGARVYTPEDIGAADVIISGRKIVALSAPRPLTEYSSLRRLLNGLRVIDLTNKTIIPGLVDVHVHVAGGGGEIGPRSRTPEAALSEFAKAGVTTFVGLLGTDEVGRSMGQLLAKIRALSSEGLTGFAWTGGYRVPVSSLTGSIKSDIVLIQEIIGVGEVAISDHRSSFPGLPSLFAIASDARVGGMLSQKPGILYAHIGALPSGLRPLLDLAEQGFPIQNLFPTHVTGRGPALIRETKDWIRAGGFADFTADAHEENATESALLEFRRSGIRMDHVTLSSDSNGSRPRFDSVGRVVSYSMGRMTVLMDTMRTLVSRHQWPIPDALRLSTANPSSYLNLEGKGTLRVGGDADIVVFSGGTSGVLDRRRMEYVWANGELMKNGTWLKKGMFESRTKEAKHDVDFITRGPSY